MSLIRFAFLAIFLAASSSLQAQIAFRAAASAGAAAGGTIAYVADNSGGGSDASRTVTRPGTDVAGRLMVAQVVLRGTGFTVTAPAGWTLVDLTENTNVTQAVYWKRMTGAEPASYQWSWGSTVRNAVGIVSYDNVDTVGNPIDAWDVSAQNANTVTFPGVTTLAPNSWLVALAATTRADGFALPTGMDTEHYDQSSAGGPNGVGAAQSTQAIVTPGAVASKTAQVGGGGNSTDNIGHMLVLRPLGALTINVPTGTLADDVMIASVAWRASGINVTAPAGWTLVRQTTQGGGETLRLATWRRVATGSEPASYIWSFSGNHAGAAGAIAGFSGVDTTNPVDVEGGGTTASSFTHAAAAVTTTTADTMVVSSHAFASASTWTPPAGMTEAADAPSQAVFSAAGVSLGVNYVAQAAIGTTGAKSATAANTAPADASVGAAHMVALRRLAGHTHYGISAPSGTTFASCEPAVVEITAHDALHAAVVPAAGTVMNLATSTATGDWQAFNAGAGDLGVAANFTPTGSNAGTATYTWSGTESVLRVRISQAAGTNFNVNLSDGSRTEDGGEDPAYSVVSSVLRITANGTSSATVATQIAGKRNTEGANTQALFVQVIATSPGTGNCEARFRNQSRNIQFAAVCNNPTTCFDPDVNDAPLFEVFSGDGTGAAVNIAKNNNTVTPASYSTVSLNFSNDANAMAPLVFRYGDAGQVTLHLRHVLPGAGGTLSGASNAFVVRPFGMAIRGANAATPIAHSSTDAGSVLAAAGDNFTMTIAAYKWQSAAEDVNANGIPDFALADVVDITDNGLTPNFAPATLSVNAGNNLPGIATGAITRGVNCASAATVAAGSWSGGAATITDWCYSEAGNVQVAALAVDYISPGVNVIGLSSFDGTGFTGGHVGRFRPKHFAVSGAALGNRASAACAPPSTFSYMDEDLALSFTLTAQNAQNATTQNYTGTYAKLGLTTFANWSLGARSGTTNLTSRLDTGVAPTGSWVNGVASGVVVTSAVNRATPDLPDGPYAAIGFGIAPVDADSVAMNTLDLDVDNNAVMDRKNLGVSGEVRYGRLRIHNALGSAKLALPVPVRLEHWNGTAFAVNTADSCTTLARNSIALGSYTGALAPGGGNCKTFIQQDPVSFASGLATLTLAPPTGAASGSVVLTPQLHATAAGNSCDNASSGEDAVASAARPYLTGRWNDAQNPDADANTSYDDNPSGRASFGVYGSQPNNYIYFRENY